MKKPVRSTFNGRLSTDNGPSSTILAGLNVLRSADSRSPRQGVVGTSEFAGGNNSFSKYIVRLYDCLCTRIGISKLQAFASSSIVKYMDISASKLLSVQIDPFMLSIIFLEIG